MCHKCLLDIERTVLSCMCSYANSESYRRALEDFDAALAINPSHANAQKYTCDTLLALARR